MKKCFFLSIKEIEKVKYMHVFDTFISCNVNLRPSQDYGLFEPFAALKNSTVKSRIIDLGLNAELRDDAKIIIVIIIRGHDWRYP